MCDAERRYQTFIEALQVGKWVGRERRRGRSGTRRVATERSAKQRRQQTLGREGDVWVVLGSLSDVRQRFEM